MKVCSQVGFSYTEVLVATALIAVALIPMLDALTPGLQGVQIHREQAEIHFVLQGKMEEVLAQPAGSTTIGEVFEMMKGM